MLCVCALLLKKVAHLYNIDAETAANAPVYGNILRAFARILFVLTFIVIVEITYVTSAI